jgi:hypothetical protein
MINIFSVHNNKTHFLKIQNDSFKKNILDSEFRHVVINNATDPDCKGYINKYCKANDIEVYENTPTYSNTNYILGEALNTIKNNIEMLDGKIAIIESDVFPFKKTLIENILLDADVAGIYQQRFNSSVEYFHPCFFIAKNKDIFKKLDWYPSPGVDTGGKTNIAIKENKFNIKWLKHTAQLEDKNEEEIFLNTDKKYFGSFGSMIIESSFIHYNRGSGWNTTETQQYHDEKLAWLNNFIEKPLIDYDKLNIFETTTSHSHKHYNGTPYNHYPSYLNLYYNK